jgi:hypothetical protein
MFFHHLVFNFACDRRAETNNVKMPKGNLAAAFRLVISYANNASLKCSASQTGHTGLKANRIT